MPNLRDQPVQGGPTMPVWIMNGAPGSSGGGNSAFGSNVGVASGLKSAAGINSLIAAPGAGYRIVVYTLLVQNESTTLTTIELRDAVTRWRAVLASQGSILVLAFEMLNPWKLNENTALSLWLSAANSHNYNVQYSIEPI